MHAYISIERIEGGHLVRFMELAERKAEAERDPALEFYRKIIGPIFENQIRDEGVDSKKRAWVETIRAEIEKLKSVKGPEIRKFWVWESRSVACKDYRELVTAIKRADAARQEAFRLQKEGKIIGEDYGRVLGAQTVLEGPA